MRSNFDDQSPRRVDVEGEVRNSAKRPLTAAANPRVGMMATVRNRRGIIVSVDPFDTKTDGRMHMVRVEYADSEGPANDTLLSASSNRV